MDEVDLDSPVVPTAKVPVKPQPSRSAGLLTTGIVLLACQQVLGPLVSNWIFFVSSGAADDAAARQTAFTVLYFGVFVVGLVTLLVGVARFASHVHSLAELAMGQGVSLSSQDRRAGG